MVNRTTRNETVLKYMDEERTSKMLAQQQREFKNNTIKDLVILLGAHAKASVAVVKLEELSGFAERIKSTTHSSQSQLKYQEVYQEDMQTAGISKAERDAYHRAFAKFAPVIKTVGDDPWVVASHFFEKVLPEDIAGEEPSIAEEFWKYLNKRGNVKVPWDERLLNLL